MKQNESKISIVVYLRNYFYFYSFFLEKNPRKIIFITRFEWEIGQANK